MVIWLNFIINPERKPLEDLMKGSILTTAKSADIAERQHNNRYSAGKPPKGLRPRMAELQS
ncbi:MAG: hypothetical protein QGF31_04405 [Nitrospinota bacterium]|nr:hypothetical protein [Nitrospinota bacterium]